MSDASIKRSAQSITQTRPALNHFTDRHEAMRRFAEYLNVDPVPTTTLFFHGEGGNGKSLLVRFLNDRCAKRLPPEKWREAAAKTGDAFTRYIVQADPAYTIPSARIDLRYGVKRVLKLLLCLSHQLAPSGIRFPLFTFACIQYWKATRQLTPDRVKSNFPNEELDFALAVANDLTGLVPGTSTAMAFFKLVKKRLGPRFDDYFSRHKLGNEFIDTIGQLDAEELYQELPLIFADDLNAAMRAVDAPKRVVLITDTYERFWGTPRNVVPSEHPERDAWFRLLLTSLDREAGIVTVVAGREKPWWDTLVGEERIAFEAMEIDDFSDADAFHYLERIAKHDPRVRPRLIELARIDENRVHPLLLGLAADIAIAGHRQGKAIDDNLAPNSSNVEAIGKRLIRHLLEYADDDTRYAVRALSACRQFSIAEYECLGVLHGVATPARFDALTHLSFIQQTEAISPDGQSTYEMHDLLRRLIREQNASEVGAAHRILEQYYRSRNSTGDTGAAIEAIYHANQLEWERGATEWVTQFEEALQTSKHERCRALIDLRTDLTVPSLWWQARILTLTAAFAERLSDYERAEADLLESAALLRNASVDNQSDRRRLNLLGETLTDYGRLLDLLERFDEAEDAFDESLNCFDEAIAQSPDQAWLYNNLADTRRAYGDHYKRTISLRSARRYFELSVASYDDALRLAPDDPGVLNNRAIAVVSIASIAADSNRFDEALDLYEQGILALVNLLDRTPDPAGAYNNLAILYEIYGNLLARIDQIDAAQRAYDQGMSWIDQAILDTPDNPDLFISRANTLRSQGDLFRELGQHDEAEEMYLRSVESNDDALVISPYALTGLVSRGLSLSRLAALLASGNDHRERASTYSRDARESLTLVLRLAPNHSTATDVLLSLDLIDIVAEFNA